MKMKKKSAAQMAGARKIAAARHAMGKLHAEAIRYGLIHHRHVEKRPPKEPFFSTSDAEELVISQLHELRKVIWRKF
jgi:hypothetical protein